jgi:cephalosporin-C deacetylase-like acetyl esterase
VKRKYLLGIPIVFVIILGGIYCLLWPGASDQHYRESLSLFAYDTETPLDIQELSSAQAMRVTRIELTYASPVGGRVPATLYIPEGKGPFPALILVYGMPGRRQDMNGLARRYAEAGVVALSIDAPHARSDTGRRPPLYYTAQDRDDQIQLIIDLRRAVDLLVARTDVDSERLAYIGLSYGSAMGGLLAGVEDRLQACVLIVGDGGLVSHLTGPDNLFGTLYHEIPNRGERRAWINAM